jgi:hypothetical protein
VLREKMLDVCPIRQVTMVCPQEKLFLTCTFYDGLAVIQDIIIAQIHSYTLKMHITNGKGQFTIEELSTHNKSIQCNAIGQEKYFLSKIRNCIAFHFLFPLLW